VGCIALTLPDLDNANVGTYINAFSGRGVFCWHRAFYMKGKENETKS